MSNPPDRIELDSHQVGTQAGRVWRYLDRKGPAALVRIRSDLGLGAALLHLALGWLCREDKVRFSKKKGLWWTELK